MFAVAASENHSDYGFCRTQLNPVILGVEAMARLGVVLDFSCLTEVKFDTLINDDMNHAVFDIIRHSKSAWSNH